MDKEKRKKKKYNLFLFLQILFLTLSICSTLGLYVVLCIYPGLEYFNPKLYEYYNDKTNYIEFTCKIIFISAEDAYLEIISENIVEKNIRPQKVTLIIDNRQVAFNNGMFRELNSGDELQILSTYIDCSPHDSIFFVAEIKKGNKIYLDFNTGYKNVIDDLEKKGDVLKISFSICVSFCVPSIIAFVLFSVKRKKLKKNLV